MCTPWWWSKEVETCCSCNILIVKLYILIFCVLLVSYTIMRLFRCMHWLSCVKSFYVVRNLLQMHVELDVCTRTLRKKNRELFYLSTLSFARILWRRCYWDGWNISMEHLWNDTNRGTPKYRQKGLTQHHFVHQKTRTRSNPGLHGDRPTTTSWSAVQPTVRVHWLKYGQLSHSFITVLLEGKPRLN
jgi:hypothetical protein